MIKINNRFSTKKDQYCWVLEEKQEKHNEKKGDYTVEKQTYHGSLVQVCEAVLERTAGDCDSIADIKDLFENAVERLVKEIQPAKKKRARRVRK